MTDVVCPNCHSVTPPYKNCMACNAFLGAHLLCSDLNKAGQVEKPSNKRPASGWWPLSNIIALIWSVFRRLEASLGRGSEAKTPMDAHLRRACRRMGRDDILKLPTTSTKDDEVAVIAKVTDLSKFKDLKQVRSVTTTIEGIGDDQTTLLTARIQGDEHEIEQLRSQPFVKSLKAAARVRQFLEQAKRETWGDEGLLREDGPETNGGDGVIVGIVDFGLDFAHRNFRFPDGKTRILALWDQKAQPEAEQRPKPFGYGRVFNRDEINEALEKTDPYEALGYDVARGSFFDTDAHGTYVTDVAAGNGLGTHAPGIAPQADIVFVDVSTVGTLVRDAQAVGNTFGDSVQLLEACKFIFDYAGDRPCVINISLGTNGGPHDGTTLVEEAIDRLASQKPNRAIVIAAGNSFGKAIHATGRVPDRRYVDLKWRIPRYDSTSNELELWYAREDRFTIDLINPDGKRVARVRPGQTWEKPGRSKGLITIVNRLDDPGNEDNTINLFFERGVPAGIWTLRLHGDSAPNGRFHAWIERDEYGQSRFVKATDKSYAVNNECTLSSIACGHKTIVVGSYNAYEPDLPLSECSSSGPTRVERELQQPTISAPGENVLAAQSGTLVLRHRQSGTSISAAVVTGTVALILSEARTAGITLSVDQIRDILIRTARKSPPACKDWDPGYGYGRVCAKAAIEYVRYELGGKPQQASAAGSGGD